MKKPSSKYLAYVFILFIAVLNTSCGGGGAGGAAGGGSPSGGGALLTINGTVFDVSNSASVPLTGATVTVRNMTNTPLLSTTSSNKGSFSLTNVPASIDIYINVSKSSYASVNTEILNLKGDTSGNLSIVSIGVAKSMADSVYGSSGGYHMGRSFL